MVSTLSLLLFVIAALEIVPPKNLWVKTGLMKKEFEERLQTPMKDEECNPSTLGSSH